MTWYARLHQTAPARSLPGLSAWLVAGLVLASAQPGAGQSAGTPITTDAPVQLETRGPSDPSHPSHPEEDHAVPEQAGPPTSSGATNDETAQVLHRLRGIVLRLDSEIADLKRLRQWQAQFIAAARIDPESAWRQRRPMSACRATALAPFCTDLTGLFKPDGEDAQ